LAQAAQELKSTRVTCLAQVDRVANMHQLTADVLMRIIAGRLVRVARDELGLPISVQLASAADVPVEELGEHRRLPSELFRSGGINISRAAVAEVERVSPQGRVALLIDGLEKLLPGPGAREIFDALSQLPESVDLIAVIPWHAAFGGGTEAVLRAGEHLHRVAALDIEGAAGATAASFLGRVMGRRLRSVTAFPGHMESLLGRAFLASGGIPRVFLQLVADAGTYARVKHGAAWPSDSDLGEAIADQQDSFRRALLPGDTDAIKRAIGTDGRELDLDRRVRLLAQGIVLERVHEGRVWLQLHPMAEPAIGARG
jgi:hypothetical protein